MCALDAIESYIDPLSLTRAMSERTAIAADINARAMCAWREECNAIVDEHVPAAERKFVHLALDQFAVCIGPDVTTQGSSRAPYILAHSAKPNEKHKSNDMYNPAFKVAIRQLKAYDEMYDLRRSDVLFDDDADEYTSLAERAERAWEGPDSLNGKVTSSLTPFATTSLYFGRTFPLRLLSDLVPAAFAHYILIIWVCPRMIWLVYFATPLVFSVVDSTFCGYVPTNAKATVNHMIDTDGTRADLARILREARHGTAFYHSDSQPQPNVETGMMSPVILASMTAAPSMSWQDQGRLSLRRYEIVCSVREENFARRFANFLVRICLRIRQAWRNGDLHRGWSVG